MDSAGMIGVASASTSLTVGGRYRLLGVAGSGAMGRVWRAHDELLNREVAVKELAGPTGISAAQRRAAQLRAEQEARGAVGFDDPGLLRIFDVVRTTGRSWIVMEYIRSRSLHDRVIRDGPLSHREAMSVGLGMVQALGTAHTAGLLHRGVEPRHVLIAEDGRVVLTDLGVAPAVEISPPATGGTQPLFGSRHYVAPELRIGGVATEATDLWSLGATLYTAVEGYPPLAEAAGALDRPRNPGPLHPLIAGLLAADPAARTTAAGTRDALEALVNRAVGVSAVPAPRLPADGVVRFEPAVVAAINPGPVPEPTSGRRRRLCRAGLVAAVASVTSAAFVATASIGAQMHGRRSDAVGSSSTAAPVSSGPCAGASRQSVSAAATAPTSVPAGWRWHVDPAGFALPVPPGWIRAAINGVVCFSDPGGGRVFSVDSELLADDGPLLHWQAAEISALAGGRLPEYQRVSMGAPASGGADWEYTWQPAMGPRLHTRQVLPAVGDGSSDGLSWTTPDRDWASSAVEQRTLVAGFRDRTIPG